MRPESQRGSRPNGFVGNWPRRWLRPIAWPRRIDGFEAGEEGERVTAEALAGLSAEFLVHHDLRIDGSDANVDHVIVGPTGVYVIDSKHWAGRVSIGRGTLWCGRHPQRRRSAGTSRSRWRAMQTKGGGTIRTL